MFLQGLILGLVLAGVVVTLALMAGFLSFINRFPALSAYISLTWDTMGSSVIWFFLDLCLYLVSMFRLRQMLKAREEVKTSYWYRLNEYSINLFFGIGVIYTAIGMQSALSNSLSGLDEQSAAALGAWGILRHLINGGILTALMTTIVGGVGGYALRLTRQIFLGNLIEQERQRTRYEHERQVLTLLMEIRDALGRSRMSEGD